MIAARSEFSSELSAYLDMAGTRHPLSQLGPGFLILRNAADVAPGQGEIVMFHDGEESRLPVKLPNGSSRSALKVEYEKLARSS